MVCPYWCYISLHWDRIVGNGKKWLGPICMGVCSPQFVEAIGWWWVSIVVTLFCHSFYFFSWLPLLVKCSPFLLDFQRVCYVFLRVFVFFLISYFFAIAFRMDGFPYAILHVVSNVKPKYKQCKFVAWHHEGDPSTCTYICIKSGALELRPNLRSITIISHH